MPPPPTPSQQAGTGQTPPVQRPQERSTSVLNTLERLRQSQPQRTPPTAPAEPGARRAQRRRRRADRRRAPDRRRASAGSPEQISECWNVDAGAPNLSEIVVELRVQLDGQGNVRNVLPASGVPSEARARAVYESARRALLVPQCNPLKVPAAKLPTLAATTFRFNPEGPRPMTTDRHRDHPLLEPPRRARRRAPPRRLGRRPAVPAAQGPRARAAR